MQARREVHGAEMVFGAVVGVVEHHRHAINFDAASIIAIQAESPDAGGGDAQGPGGADRIIVQDTGRQDAVEPVVTIGALAQIIQGGNDFGGVRSDRRIGWHEGQQGIGLGGGIQGGTIRGDLSCGHAGNQQTKSQTGGATGPGRIAEAGVIAPGGSRGVAGSGDFVFGRLPGSHQGGGGELPSVAFISHLGGILYSKISHHGGPVGHDQSQVFAIGGE